MEDNNNEPVHPNDNIKVGDVVVTRINDEENLQHVGIKVYVEDLDKVLANFEAANIIHLEA